ncbi:DUF1622 domain-containing protein [Streptomyces sp. 900105755]
MVGSRNDAAAATTVTDHRRAGFRSAQSGDTVEIRNIVEFAGRTVDAAGVAVIVLGVLLATVLAVVRMEFLVAGDITRTVAVAPAYASVGVLAVIVGIRSQLFSRARDHRAVALAKASGRSRWLT